MGRNHSDYHYLFNLFQQIIERANSMNSDPTAFVDKFGYNEKLISAWTKMIATAKSILEALSKMRNADKMVGLMIEDHTKVFTQACCVEIGNEIKKVIEVIDTDEDRDQVVIMLKRLMYKKIPEVFLKAAVATVNQTKADYHVMH